METNINQNKLASKKMRTIPKEKENQIIEMYSQSENISAKDISKLINITNHTILRVLRRNNIPIRTTYSYRKFRPSKKKINLPEKEVIGLYEKDNSIYDIAEKFNCGVNVICRILKEHKIKMKGAGYFNKIQEHKHKKYPEEEIYKDYLCGLSQPQLQKKYKISSLTLVTILNKNNIPRRKITIKERFTEEQINLICDLYVNKLQSSKKIGKKFGIDCSTVCGLLRKRGIKIKSVKDYPLSENQIKNISKRMKEIMNRPHMRENLSEIKKNQYKSGLEPWNKGLTANDNDKVKEGILKMKKWKEENVLGKTYEELYGLEKAKRLKENIRLKGPKNKGKDNPMYGTKWTKEREINHSNIMKEKYKSGEVVTWSKGLTKEDDPRIKKFSELSALRIGEKACNWQGGKSFEPYGLEFNNKLRKEIRRRDNNECILCRIYLAYEKEKYENKEIPLWIKELKISKIESELNQKLHVHHVDYCKTNNSKSNLISLCCIHHLATNSKHRRQKWTAFLQNILHEKYGYKYSEDGNVIIELVKEAQ